MGFCSGSKQTSSCSALLCSHSNFLPFVPKSSAAVVVAVYIDCPIDMELFAGFNAEELAMMQELLRLLVEDDDAQPIPGSTPAARHDGQSRFEDLPGASPKLAGAASFDGYYLWNMGGPSAMAWNAPVPAGMAPAPQLPPKAARTRTRSTFASDDEPMLKRGRADVAPSMNRIAVPDGAYCYY